MFVFLPLNKRTIWSFQMVCMQIHYVCTSLSLCLEVQISARTVPESLKFHSSKIPGLLSCWQLQEQNAKRCEKQQLTHCRLLAAGVSKDADFRPLDTDANPPLNGLPQQFLRLYWELIYHQHQSNAYKLYVKYFNTNQPTDQPICDKANEDDPEKSEE